MPLYDRFGFVINLKKRDSTLFFPKLSSLKLTPKIDLKKQGLEGLLL